jgi:hypothetical protein
MVHITLYCDQPRCRKAAEIFRHESEQAGTWKLIGQWKSTAAKEGMLHACSYKHAEEIDKAKSK